MKNSVQGASCKRAARNPSVALECTTLSLSAFAGQVACNSITYHRSDSHGPDDLRALTLWAVHACKFVKFVGMPKSLYLATSASPLGERPAAADAWLLSTLYAVVQLKKHIAIIHL
jgi:hypothetical protein